MAEPAREHPEGFETRANPSHEIPPAPDRPEWLVGAEDVLEAKPDFLERPQVPARRASPSESAPPAPARPTAWTAAASSVPKLKAVPPLGEPPDSPGDESTEELEASDTSRPLDPPSQNQAHAPPRLQPLDEPWWLIWTERLVGDRRILIGGLALVLLGGGAALWKGREKAGVPLATIKRHAQQFEGRQVTVNGRVGEVFEIGQGYVFWLHQGRDTVAVFSPTRRPTTRERLSVVGTVSTGYLDGIPRVALFESP